MVAKMSLREHNYDVTESECPREECEGNLWVNSFELVCDTCNHAFRDGGQKSVENRDPIREYEDNRDEYRYNHSDRVIMQGGFFDEREDILPDDNGIYGMDNDEDDFERKLRY